MTEPVRVKTLVIDGRDVSARETRPFWKLRRKKAFHPHHVPPGGIVRGWRVPPLPGRSEGSQQAAARVRDQS